MFLRFLFISLCCFTLHTDEAVITWSESYKLTWNDFKGTVLKDTDAVATTASGITFSYAIKRTDNKGIVGFKTKILAHFYPDKSWYKAAKADNHILAHEQFHFNITELYSRKFRERVAGVKISPNVHLELEKIHQEINHELSELQQQYDAETDFSRDFKQQAIWEKHIKQELAKLAKYKSK